MRDTLDWVVLVSFQCPISTPWRISEQRESDSPDTQVQEVVDPNQASLPFQRCLPRCVADFQNRLKLEALEMFPLADFSNRHGNLGTIGRGDPGEPTA